MRPRAASPLLAALVAQTPPRLLKKLDSDPALADSWTWHQDGRVVTSTGETVSITTAAGILESLEDLTCSCLLAPRCLHRLAVLSVLPPAEAPDREPAEGHSKPEVGSGEAPLSETQREAAALLWSVASRLLEAGGSACGVVMQGELLRAGFACRECGLYRAHASTQRVLDGVRALRAGNQEFSLESWMEGLREMLLVAHQLHGRGESSQLWKGTARRRYDPVGNLKLWGLFTEPVLTASGYAGVVTWLCDEKLRLFQLSDVAPGDFERVRAAYRSGAPLAGASHSMLGRQQILLQSASASQEGRLGLGQGVKAALSQASSWESPELQPLWQPGPTTESDLRFFEGEVLGSERDALVVSAPAGPLRLLPPSEGELPGRDNLSLLSRRPGQSWRWIARLHPRLPRTATALAVSCQTKPEWNGRCNLGCDRLHASFFPDLEPRARQLELPQPARAFEELERALQRVALAGRAAATANPDLLRRWKERGQTTCAILWSELVAAAEQGERDLLGLWRPVEPEAVARRWLALATYHQAANDNWRRAVTGPAASQGVLTFRTSSYLASRCCSGSAYGDDVYPDVH